MDETTTEAPKEKDRADSSTTTVPADPVDDVVTTEHTLRIGRTAPRLHRDHGSHRPT